MEEKAAEAAEKVEVKAAEAAEKETPSGFIAHRLRSRALDAYDLDPDTVSPYDSMEQHKLRDFGLPKELETHRLDGTWGDRTRYDPASPYDDLPLGYIGKSTHVLKQKKHHHKKHHQKHMSSLEEDSKDLESLNNLSQVHHKKMVQKKTKSKDAYDLDPFSASPYDDAENVNGDKNPHLTVAETGHEADHKSEFDPKTEVGTDKEETEKELQKIKEKKAEEERKALGGAGDIPELSRAQQGEAKKAEKAHKEDVVEAIEGAIPDLPPELIPH